MRGKPDVAMAAASEHQSLSFWICDQQHECLVLSLSFTDQFEAMTDELERRREECLQLRAMMADRIITAHSISKESYGGMGCCCCFSLPSSSLAAGCSLFCHLLGWFFILQSSNGSTSVYSRAVRIQPIWSKWLVPGFSYWLACSSLASLKQRHGLDLVSSSQWLTMAWPWLVSTSQSLRMALPWLVSTSQS